MAAPATKAAPTWARCRYVCAAVQTEGDEQQVGPIDLRTETPMPRMELVKQSCRLDCAVSLNQSSSEMSLRTRAVFEPRIDKIRVLYAGALYGALYCLEREQLERDANALRTLIEDLQYDRCNNPDLLDALKQASALLLCIR
jgi:hypothetical protein